MGGCTTGGLWAVLSSLELVQYAWQAWPLTLREEHTLRVFENVVLRNILWLKWDETIGCWRKLRNERFHQMHLEWAIEGGYHLLSRWFLASRIPQPCIWKQLFPTKRQLTFHGLHGDISQSINIFRTKRMGCVEFAPRTDYNVHVRLWWEIRKEKGHQEYQALVTTTANLRIP